MMKIKISLVLSTFFALSVLVRADFFKPATLNGKLLVPGDGFGMPKAIGDCSVKFTIGNKISSTLTGSKIFTIRFAPDMPGESNRTLYFANIAGANEGLIIETDKRKAKNVKSVMLGYFKADGQFDQSKKISKMCYFGQL